MMNNFFEKNIPPGIDVSRENRFFLLGLLASFFWSLGFFSRYAIASQALYTYDSYYGYRLQQNAQMEDFHSVLGWSLIGFGILGFSMIGYAIYHYMYYHQGSKSIYVMKRLSDPLEMHRRALTLPFLFLLISLLAALLLLLLYYAIYMLVTPDECIPPDQWQKLWRCFL